MNLILIDIKLLPLNPVGVVDILLVCPVGEVCKILFIRDASATIDRINFTLFAAPNFTLDVREALAGELVEGAHPLAA